MKTKIYRAGMIPYYIEENKINYMMMKPSNPEYGGDFFQIAKGRVEPDEDNVLDTAIREASEELGFKEENSEFIRKVGIFLGRTTIFISKIKDKNDFNNFHFETKEVKWFSLEDFISSGRNIHIPILKRVEKFIYENNLI